MNQLPLPNTIRGSFRAPKLQEYTFNLIMSDGALIPRPSFDHVYVSFSQPVDNHAGRTTFVYDDKIYSVFNRRLHEGIPNPPATITANLIPGFIEGTDDIRFAKGFNGVALAAGNGGNYFVNATDDGNGNKTLTSITLITDPDLPECIDVTRVDGRFVWTPKDGSPLKYSNVNDAGNIQTLSFFDAETSIDKNLGTVNIRNDLFVLGEDSIERFRSVGVAASPFLRVQNSIISVGYVGGLIETKDSFMFLGRDKDRGFGFFVYASGTVAKISSIAVDEQLNTRAQEEGAAFARAKGERFSWAGIDCYVFSVLGVNYMLTIAGGQHHWSYFTEGSAFIERDGFSRSFLTMRNFTFYRGVWYAQNEHGMHKMIIGNNDRVQTDFQGNLEERPVIKGFQTYVRDVQEAVITPSALELNIEGVNTTDHFPSQTDPLSASLSLSKDGIDWTPDYTKTIGLEENNRMKFQPLGGLGLYEGYMGIRVSSTSNANFTIDNMVLS